MSKSASLLDRILGKGWHAQLGAAEQPRWPKGDPRGGQWKDTGQAIHDDPNLNITYAAKEERRFQDTAERISEGLGLYGQDEYGVSERDTIADYLIEWASDSNSYSGVILQIAAQQEFGIPISTYTMKRAEKYGIDPEREFDLEKKMLRYIYDTKSKFRTGTVKLYRATNQSTPNALESWTTDLKIARSYVRPGDDMSIITKNVPANKVIGSWHDGLGLEFAKEVVVMK